MSCKSFSAAHKARLFLIDDEPAVRRGLFLFFNLQPCLSVCGDAASESEALERIPALQPDLAVVDLSLKQGDGLSLLRRLHRDYPALKLLVYSMHAESGFAAAAFRAGADGYVTKEEGTEKVLEAIQSLVEGELYLSDGVAWKAPGLLAQIAAERANGLSKPPA